METEADIFTRYAGHVQSFTIEICGNGWKSGKNTETFCDTVMLDMKDDLAPEKRLRYVYQNIKKIALKKGLEVK